MNFAAFQLWRDQLRLATPGLLDCAETNLYRSLASIQPNAVVSGEAMPAHRCDLARLWLSRQGYSPDLSRRALVCRGVRHALSMIFQDLARRESTVWLPGDVYPVYLTLAGDAGLRTRLYPTLPEPSFPAGEPGDGIDHLLVANPLKPLGRYLTQAEVAAFTKWLDTSPSRRILVDCVYDLGDRFHDSTRQLQASGRAILLHSVTKGWLWPRTFGVALVPDGEFEASFRAEPPSRDQLCLARWLLSIDATRPGRVAKALQSRARILADRMPGAVRRRLVGDLGGSFPGCYFFPVEMGAEELLEGHEILAIPASAFGSKWPGSILTSLSAAFAVAE